MILLTKCIYLNIHKRYMHRTPGPKKIIALCQASLSHHPTQSPTAALRHGAHTQVRGMASLHAGRLKKPLFTTGTKTASSDTTQEVQSDCTGKHHNVVASVCSKPGCKDHNCATGSDNPCGLSSEYHQTPLENQDQSQNSNVVYEYVGALTHKVPSHMQGKYLSPTDYNGVPHPQYIVIEPGTVPVSPKNFTTKESTHLVQQDDITVLIMERLPATSVVNLPREEITISKCNTPLDDGF